MFMTGICIHGGISADRLAAIHEIIRQGLKKPDHYPQQCRNDFDMLIGAAL